MNYSNSNVCDTSFEIAVKRQKLSFEMGLFYRLQQDEQSLGFYLVPVSKIEAEADMESNNAV